MQQLTYYLGQLHTPAFSLRNASFFCANTLAYCILDALLYTDSSKLTEADERAQTMYQLAAMAVAPDVGGELLQLRGRQRINSTVTG